MAYRKTTRRRATRSAARPARRVTRRASTRRPARKGGQTVRIVIQHESANASGNPGGMEMPQVQKQTKKAKF